MAERARDFRTGADASEGVSVQRPLKLISHPRIDLIAAAEAPVAICSADSVRDRGRREKEAGDWMEKYARHRIA